MGKKSKLKKERRQLRQRILDAQMATDNDEEFVPRKRRIRKFCDIEASKGCGVYIGEGVSDIKFIRSTITGFTSSGLYINKDADVGFYDSNISNNGLDAITIFDNEKEISMSKKNILNEASDKELSVVQQSQRPSIIVSNSNISGNGGHGIRKTANSNIRVDGTNISNNGLDGIHEADSEDNKLLAALQETLNIIDKLNLSSESESDLRFDIESVKMHLKHPNRTTPRVRSVMKSTLLSIKTILETTLGGAAGIALHQNIPTIIMIIGGYIMSNEAMIAIATSPL